MYKFSQNDKPSWDVLLIGGPSGTGKSRVSYALAHHFDVGITEVDDLHTAIVQITTPEQQPVLHYWETKPEDVHLSAEQMLELHVSVGQFMLPALEAVVENHIESQTPIILEGDYILPELMALASHHNSKEDKRVRAVFIYEPDEKQILNNFLQREPEEGEQAGRAHVSWLYGEWLIKECKRYGLPALPATPWDSLFDRIVKAIG